MSNAPLKIGLIGLDTSHSTAFAGIFNDANNQFHIPGAKITHGYAGGSPDMPVSINRVQGFTDQLKKDHGVTILDSPEAVAKEVEIVFITACDGRTHLDYFKKIAPIGKPTFIDKPFAGSLADAKAIAKLAKEKNIPVASCSSLRFADGLTAALQAAKADDPIHAVDVYGPMNLQPPIPGLFWYGVHGVEMIIRTMGQGCVSVQANTTEKQDLVTGIWADGRIASYHGMRASHSRFGLLIHRASGVQFVDASTFTVPWYYSMLKELIPAFAQGKSAVPVEDALAVTAFMETANTSRDHQGQVVAFPSLAF